MDGSIGLAAAPARAAVDGDASGDTTIARPRRRTRTRAWLPWVLPLALAAGWELAVRGGFAEGRLLPPPSAVFDTLATLAADGELLRHVLASLSRIAAGFALGALAGTVLGAACAALPLLRGALDPSLQALRAIPSIAWVPLFILWFGIFEGSKVALIALGVFFPVYLGVLGAVLGVDRHWIEVGRVFRLGRLALARRILLPAVLPAWVLALRAGLGLGWMFVVAAELMGASEGLGYLLLDGQQTGRAPQIVAAIVAFGVLGRATDVLLALAARPLARGRDDLARSQESA
jgi:sulfonate transport system permease protein